MSNRSASNDGSDYLGKPARSALTTGRNQDQRLDERERRSDQSPWG